MRIAIIGPGIMPIPPSGWGAVESLIWDYATELKELGHDVRIINTPNPNEIVNSVNSINPDFVHLQYDNLFFVMPHINCKNKAVTSHYGYIDQKNRYGGYQQIFDGFVNSDFRIFCLSPEIMEIYRQAGVSEDRLELTPNGARSDLFRYSEETKFPDKSIYLAKITDRKKQYLYQDFESIDFAGNIDDYRFDTGRKNYLGEWSKEHLYDNLTNYSNLVLFSDGEAHPLVCCEALMAGLGLVISKVCSANLDTDLPFITVIPDEKLNDVDYVKEKIKENQEISNKMRKEIRQYALDNFSWKKVVPKYLEKIKK
jgi:glycosyltransferase involved in cell wall biosynthesis